MSNSISIKAGLSAIVFLFSATTIFCQATTGQSVMRPSVSVEFENEILSLAKGYEKAFNQFPAGGKYIQISTASGPRFLDGSVRSIEAHEGVLMIRMERGPIYVINARDIIKLTNEKP